MTTLRSTLFVLLACMAIRSGVVGAYGGPHSPDPDSPWKNVGTGDFNGDGNDDILWRHDNDGKLLVWLMDGFVHVGDTSTSPSAVEDVRWRVCATGDFNSDGKVDILWRHEDAGQLVVWFMDGLTMTSGAFIDTSSLTDLSWRVRATGDFNSDGKVDILWRHEGSGQVSVWFMDGLTRLGGTLATPESAGDVNWVATATGDFDRDGQTDILWRHQTSGEVAIWYMDGTVKVSGTLTNPPEWNLHWRLVGTGDLDGDGGPDILWQGPPKPEGVAPTGQNVVWLMGNATVKPDGIKDLGPIV